MNIIIRTLRHALVILYRLIILVLLWPLLILIFINTNKKKSTFWNSMGDFIEKVNTRVINFLRLLPLEKPSSKAPLPDPILDLRPEAIRSMPDTFTATFLPFLKYERIVIYYEPYYSENLNQFISSNYKEISNGLASKDYQFVYLNKNDEISIEHIQEMIQYFHPTYTMAQQDDNFHSGFRAALADYYATLKNLFFLEEITMPCLICLVGQRNEKPYPIYFLSEEDEHIKNTFEYYFKVIPNKYRVQARRGDYRIDDLQNEPIEINHEAYAHIESFIMKHKSKGAVSLIIKILGELKKTDAISDPRISDLARIFAYKDPASLSRLLVRSNGDLFLSDYNVTISLTPLQKTVYIFFLLKPNGILFKELSDYRKELENIYLRISNRSDLETMKKSIDDLVNPHTNSMSEKCSRIKEAFTKKFTEEIAINYCIDGGRSERKTIGLDRKLISFEEPFE